MTTAITSESITDQHVWDGDGDTSFISFPVTDAHASVYQPYLSERLPEYVSVKTEDFGGNLAITEIPDDEVDTIREAVNELLDDVSVVVLGLSEDGAEYVSGDRDCIYDGDVDLSPHYRRVVLEHIAESDGFWNEYLSETPE